MTEPRSQLRVRLGAVLLGLVALAHAMLYDSPFEDAFITYRYADHLAHGLGLTYNAGEVVEGFTSFGWTVLLAGVSWVGLPIVLVSRALSLAAGMALLWATSRLAARTMNREGSLWSLAPALLVAANGTWAYYAMTGMETTLFALLVVLGALLVGEGGAAVEAPSAVERRRSLLAALVFAAAAVVRPEGAGYFGAALAALFFDAPGRRALPAMLGIFGVLFVPFFAWRWHHFGWLAPNTYYAKASPSGAVLVAGASYVEAYFTAHLFWLAPAALAFLAMVARGARLAIPMPRRAWRVAAFLGLAAVANSVAVGGDTFPFHRFLLPAIPFGAIAIMWALSQLALRKPDAGHAALFAGVAVALALEAFAVELVPVTTLATARQRKSGYHRCQDIQAIDDDYFLVGEYLGAVLPSSTTIAVNAAGIVPYVSGLPTIDMLGLNDVHIAHAPIALGHGVSGHEKHDATYVLSRAPDVILLGLPTLMKHALQPGQLEAVVSQWFPFLPGDRDLFQSAEFRRNYQPRGARVGDHGYALLFVRAGSAAAAALP